MTLYSIDSDTPVDHVPHQKQFDEWKSRLTANELAQIDDAFGALIDQKLNAGTEIFTSSWLPSELSPDGPHDLDRTPFFVIWEKACRENWEHTGWCFGLLLWEHMMNRDEEWCFYKSGDDDIEGTRYFLRKSN